MKLKIFFAFIIFLNSNSSTAMTVEDFNDYEMGAAAGLFLAAMENEDAQTAARLTLYMKNKFGVNASIRATTEDKQAFADEVKKEISRLSGEKVEAKTKKKPKKKTRNQLNKQLFRAVKDNRINKIEKLILDGADKNYMAGCRTILQHAITICNFEAVQILIKCGAEFDTLTKYGYHTIHIMAGCSKDRMEKTVEILDFILAGFDTEKLNKVLTVLTPCKGLNAMQVATIHGNLPVFNVLQKYYEQYKLKYDRENLLDTAREHGHKEMVEHLESIK